MRRKGGREKTTLSNLSWWFISTEQSTGGLPIYVFFTFIAYIFWFSVITMDLSTKKGGGGESLGLKLAISYSKDTKQPRFGLYLT